MGLTACGLRGIDTTRDNDNCGGCTFGCPAGTNCVDSRCRCPAGLALCNTRCVDTQVENGNCGGCGIICAAGLACISGRCQCDTACAVDLNGVTCGVEVANRWPGGPSCGRGRRCASGQVCDLRNGTCVCVPRCPAGVACGTADGCGGTCSGTCTSGTCTQDLNNRTRFFCSAASCTSGYRCVQITCALGGTPCPCQCCTAGETCVGGSRCLPIPP